jgi:hypothetical protein
LPNYTQTQMNIYYLYIVYICNANIIIFFNFFNFLILIFVIDVSLLGDIPLVLIFNNLKSYLPIITLNFNV